MSGMENEAQKNVILQGIGVSPGVAVDRAFLLRSDEDAPVVERSITDEDIPAEIARLEDALLRTREQIHAIQQEISQVLGHEDASIFDAHLLVVDDRSFVDEVIRGLSVYYLNVEAVMQRVSERYAEALSKVEDDYLRERAADVRDVARRIIRNLSGQDSSSLATLESSCIVIAKDIPPSETAGMDRKKVVAFATDLGSPSSHTAIMARALEIPAVVGLHDISSRVRAGDRILIDGQKGIVIIHPTDEQLDRYGKIAREQESLRHKLDRLRDVPAETLDGRAVELAANIELPGDTEMCRKHGARGIGLFRTEFLYVAQGQLPTEDMQTAAYEQVAEAMHPYPVIIRTIDVGGDKFVSNMKLPQEDNPFLGWRAIRFCLTHPDIFMTQLRAILRASRCENIKLMYPMISSVAEIRQANKLLARAMAELDEEGVPYNKNLEIGVMIEVPSAAIMADQLAAETSFFSIGTNDLVQYTLAVDRVNEKVAYLYEPTHPAILKLIKQTVDAGHKHGIWTGICGEVAGDPVLVPLLLGLGADKLSVSPNGIPLVKDVIRKTTLKDAEALAEKALAGDSAEQIRGYCHAYIEQINPEILELIE